MWFGMSNTCGGSWLDGVGQNRQIDEEQDEDCVEEALQLAKVKFERYGGGGREAYVQYVES